MAVVLKKRGRPSKADIAARAAKVAPKRTPAKMLTDLKERFEILSLLTHGAVNRNIRAMVVAGAPGVGKTYTVEKILEHSQCKHDVVRGSLSAINLYMKAYEFKEPGSVLVLDDADSIFNDEDALNILKGLCDSSAERKVSYLKEAHALGDIPQQFTFHGAMIFITNLDFQTFVDEGKNKYALHFGALMSRALYLDLRLHSRDELALWVNHVAEHGRIFDREEVPRHVRPQILQFLTEHREDLRELSIRTLMKLCGLSKDNPHRWESIARVLLTRSN